MTTSILFKRVTLRFVFLAFIAATLLPSTTRAQSLDLTAGNAGISFGDSEDITGLRFNFRDKRLRRMTGLNVTIWSPSDDVQSQVTGFALGLPMAGAQDFTGIGVGIGGFAATREATGFVVGLLGAGAGENMTGIGIGGLGAGAGGNVDGIMVGGLGAGAGEDAKGIMVGGLGAGAGQNATGLMIGGLGAGAGQDATGIMISLLAAGGGRDVTGVSVAGLAVGAGGTLKGIHVAIGAVGGQEIVGFAAALAAGGEKITGLVIAPAYLRVPENGSVNGVTISAFNHVKGEHRGVSIGIFNWAETLNGLQIGLLNFAGNKDKLKWLPFFNYHRD